MTATTGTKRKTVARYSRRSAGSGSSERSGANCAANAGCGRCPAACQTTNAEAKYTTKPTRLTRRSGHERRSAQAAHATRRRELHARALETLSRTVRLRRGGRAARLRRARARWGAAYGTPPQAEPPASAWRFFFHGPARRRGRPPSGATRTRPSASASRRSSPARLAPLPPLPPLPPCPPALLIDTAPFPVVVAPGRPIDAT